MESVQQIKHKKFSRVVGKVKRLNRIYKQPEPKDPAHKQTRKRDGGTDDGSAAGSAKRKKTVKPRN